MEIYYADGTLGIVSESRLSNPPTNVVNPRQKEGAATKATSKHNIVVNINGEPFRIAVGFWAVTTKEVSQESDKYMKDREGNSVKNRSYIKSTGVLIDDAGYGHKAVNDNGREIPKDEIRWFVTEADGTEREVQPFEKTEDISVNFKPSGTEDAYLIGDNYEVVPDGDDDSRKLWTLVKFLKDSNQIGVGLVVFRQGWKKNGILLIPYIDEKKGTYALVAKTTGKKFTLSRPVTIPSPTEEKKKAEIKKGPKEDLFE
jgi:hypothetical protein